MAQVVPIEDADPALTEKINTENREVWERVIAKVYARAFSQDPYAARDIYPSYARTLAEAIDQSQDGDVIRVLPDGTVVVGRDLA